VSLDPRLLLQFAAVAEELSFTAAARRLGVAQPWLSSRIRRLEEQMGGLLFERSTRRVALTRLGEELHRRVAPLADAAAQASAGVEALRAEAQGVLRLGCPTLGEPDARQAALLAAFAARHPHLVVQIESGAAETHAEKARRGLLDMFLAIQPPAEDDWDGLPLYRVALAAMMHAHDPLAHAPAITAEALAGRRVAVFPRRSAPALFDGLYGAMSQAGAQLQEIPELRRSLLRDQPDLVVTTLVVAPADAVLRHGLVRREVAGAEPLHMRLFRRRGGFQSGPAARFWRLSTELRSLDA